MQKTPTNAEAETTQATQVFSLRTDRLIDRQRIPIYDMEAVAGLLSLFTGDYSQQIIEFVEADWKPLINH